MLLCHGIGETVEHWLAVQTLLAEDGVASLVFDYSGYGNSTGFIHAQQCEQDAIAAFRFFGRMFPGQPIALLGYSLGSGIASSIVARTETHLLVLCATYTSLRDAACAIGLPRRLAFLVHNIWNTERVLRTCTVPVLILHSQEDRLFPQEMALSLAKSCCTPCELLLFPGLTHNAPIFDPELAYWSHVLKRL